LTARRSAHAAASAPGVPRSQPGLLHKLMAAVRPEFRADVLVADTTNPMFGPGPCAVAGCDRAIAGHGLCSGHRQRWVKAGRPDLAVFIAETDPRWRRHQPNAACLVEGCAYGSARQGMCQLHAQRWERSGRPDLAAWLVSPAPVKQPPAAGSSCRIAHCQLWPQASSPFCHSHHNTWRTNGRPDIEDFTTTFAVVPVLALQRIQLEALAPQLKLEMQYALQCRHDERRGKIQPPVVNRVVDLLARSGAVSLTDYPEPSWRQGGYPELKDTMARAFLTFAIRQVADLAEEDGWAAEYPHDVWKMRRLGYPGDLVIRFADIAQPWLRELAKRWVRWRLATGLGLDAGARRPVLAITRFSRFLNAAGVHGVAGIDRVLLERYMADLHTAFGAGNQQALHIGQLSLVFSAIRQHRWEPGLPADAMFYSADIPKKPERLPRALTEQVMTQLEQVTNLSRWSSQDYRLVTVILMRCGLRITDALKLSTDCLVTDADGAAYLRYYNHKMKREALVPIDEELHASIDEQRQRVATRWPDSARFLFPRPTKNIDGSQPLTSSTYRLALYRWLRSCDIRDEYGKPVQFTPHQWRHTLGTALINKDVPQEVVRRILDHESPQMTAHYARLHDTTVRLHWEQARKVNIQGAEIVLDPAGPLGDASWAKQRLGRATQALPNGFCGLPVQKSCPHANACLTCPMFITTAEFLPQHRQQHQQILQIISAADARGQTRVTQMNRQVADNLEKIITALEADQPQEVADAS
jgi:integrase